MAQAASTDKVAADMRPTDYRGAVNRMKAIKAKSDKQKAISGEIGDIYGKCEGVHGVNKMAAKIYYGLSKLEPEELLTVFRDINGLLDAAGALKDGADLVDQADDTVVPMRFKAPEIEDEGGIDDEIEEIADDGEKLPVDEFQEATEAELAQQAGRGTGAAAKAARKKDAAKEEPYTGDNSDLAGE